MSVNVQVVIILVDTFKYIIRYQPSIHQYKSQTDINHNNNMPHLTNDDDERLRRQEEEKERLRKVTSLINMFIFPTI